MTAWRRLQFLGFGHSAWGWPPREKRGGLGEWSPSGELIDGRSGVRVEGEVDHGNFCKIRPYFSVAETT